jgi:cytochrome c556
MRTITRFLTAGAFATLAAAVSVTAADPATKVKLPDAEYKQLVTADAKVIQDTLAKGAMDKKAVAKVKAAAVLIAEYAQNRDTPDAGVRDAALGIAKAAAGGKADEAKKLAADLSPGKGTGKPGLVNLSKEIEIEELMNVFKPERGGGQNLEKDFQTLAGKRAAYTPAEFQKIAPMAYKIAAIAQITEGLPPEQNAGKKTKANWAKWTQEMGQLAVEAGQAARAAKPDDKSVKATLRKLEKTCTDCHEVFRDAN